MTYKHLSFVSLFAVAALSASAQRNVENFNFGWQFHRGNIDVTAINTSDGSWETINVPHDFQISQPWVAPAANESEDNSDGASNFKSRLSARGFKEMGVVTSVHGRRWGCPSCRPDGGQSPWGSS